MCGILAVFFQKKSSVPFGDIMDAFNTLKNRGPDSGSLVVTDTDILGFRRLAINDISVKGEQPFVSDKSKLLCNGEIYNHKNIEKKFKIDCVSSSDCECILHLHDKVGFKDMIDELSGDYAIIIETKDTVYFARDPIGVRPLFFGYTETGLFVLGSYARLLSKLCTVIHQVIPGWGKYDRKLGGIELYRHHHATSIIGDEKLVHDTLVNSVKSRLMSDRPVGCLLSGGLDSSLIASILCKLLGPNNVRTYSIGMDGSSDLKCARDVSEYLGTNHTEVRFTPEEGFAVIPDVIRDLESYDITTIRASVAMWLLAQYISKNTDDKVLLSGEGADELFCGYLYFHYAPTSENLYDESLRLVNNLYLYDVLRADRCISSHGLELRVPFLDKDMVKLCLSLPGKVRQPKKDIEKFLLRDSFKEGYIPNNVLWRRKDGMSDGVSGSSGKKWFEQIQNFIDNKISDSEFEDHSCRFPSKEAFYYKKLYDQIHPNYQPKYEYWMPKWVECDGDPSGRVLKVFDS